MNDASLDSELEATISKAIREDWELVKGAASETADRRVIFDLAYRFGWHAATKYHRKYLESLVRTSPD